MPPQRSDTDYRAVIFDMDGVIVDSEPRHYRAFIEVMRELGYEHNHGVHWPNYLGRQDQELWIDFVARHRPKHSVEELSAMKRERVLDIIRKERPLFDGLPHLVERLSRRCKLALASGSERLVVEEVLELGLKEFFPITVTGTEIQRGKPEPDIFLKTAKLLGVAPEDCWVIEDSKPGVTAALAANMRVIAITNTHPAEELGKATVVVKTYGEIERLLLVEQ